MLVNRSNPSVEASEGEGVSRNICEPDSASKRYLQVAKLPKVLKPVISEEETVMAHKPGGTTRALTGPVGVVGGGAR